MIFVRKGIFILTGMLLLNGCQSGRNTAQQEESNSVHIASVTDNGLTPGEQHWRHSLIQQYQNAAPRLWGENISGVMTRMNTNRKDIALTFDACGGPHGSAYDSKLIDYLVTEKIHATLFINARWIDANPATFRALAANPLFEIENHGYEHRPLSMNAEGLMTAVPALRKKGFRFVKLATYPLQ